MIVEFKYVTDDESKSGFWRWIPIRVRQQTNFGRAKLRQRIPRRKQQLDVSITVEMITTGDKYR
jgi:hypothetical protein